MGRSEGRNWPPNEDHSKRAAVVSVSTVAVEAVASVLRSLLRYPLHG